jgi:hypothetical protein
VDYRRPGGAVADDFAWLALTTLLPQVGGGAALEQEETAGGAASLKEQSCVVRWRPALLEQEIIRCYLRAAQSA